MKIQTIQNFIKNEASKLNLIYEENEAKTICKILLESIIGEISTSSLILGKVLPEKFELEKWNTLFLRVLNKEPVQYITQKAWFGDFIFHIDQGALIPRPETWEIVERIVAENKTLNIRILDICTGSACIAISLEKLLNNAVVDAIELSNDAILIANKNIENHQSQLNLIKDDILDPKNAYPQYDIIVSNPPYVLESEKILMRENVLLFEPEMALFVDDNEPLVFYESIIKFASKYLKPDGKIYFEINENLGFEMSLLLNNWNYKNVTIIKDIHNKDRFAYGTKD